MNFSFNVQSENIWRLLRKRSFIVRILHRVLTTYFSPTGRALLIISIFSVSIGMIGTYIPIYMFALHLIGLATAILLEGWLHRPRKLECFTRKPEAVKAGEVFSWVIKIKYSGKMPLYDLLVRQVIRSPQRDYYQCDSVPILSLKSDQSQLVKLSFKPERRGIYEMREQLVLSGFPFNLFRWKKTLAFHEKLIVYPDYRHLSELDLKFGRQYQPGGILISSNVGDSVEFMGIRDYMDGDNPRHIHWASLARSGKLAVKEFHEEYFCRLALIIDGETKGVKKAREAFEAAISITASIADWVARQDYIIDIFATGNEVYHLQAGRSIAHLNHILEVLACLEPQKEINIDELWAAIMPEIQQLSALVCVFLSWNKARETFIDKLINTGIGLKILLIKEEPEELHQISAHILPLITQLAPQDWERLHL